MSTVVVGGGIAGLAAARELAAAGDDVLLLESAAQVGGKLRVGEVAGVQVDVGAESMLNRRPEGVDLARALGLDLVHPATITSRIWTRDALHPLPRSVMGVPADLDQLAVSGVLSDEGVARARAEVVLPGARRRRLGHRVRRCPPRRRGRRPAGRAAARWGVRRARARCSPPGRPSRRSWRCSTASRSLVRAAAVGARTQRRPRLRRPGRRGRAAAGRAGRPRAASGCAPARPSGSYAGSRTASS